MKSGNNEYSGCTYEPYKSQYPPNAIGRAISRGPFP